MPERRDKKFAYIWHRGSRSEFCVSLGILWHMAYVIAGDQGFDQGPNVLRAQNDLQYAILMGTESAIVLERWADDYRRAAYRRAMR